MMKVFACVALLALIAVGCQKEQKPAIDTKAVDKAVQQTKEAAKDATQKANDAAKDAQKAVQDAKAK